MDEMNKESTTPETTTQETKPSVPAPRQRPERRRKTKQELFKENTLPFIILGIQEHIGPRFSFETMTPPFVR